eukprot:COSAG01_NODE_5870_length_3980_cov_35.431847_5_plen_237_part_00
MPVAHCAADAPVSCCLSGAAICAGVASETSPHGAGVPAGHTQYDWPTGEDPPAPLGPVDGVWPVIKDGYMGKKSKGKGRGAALKGHREKWDRRYFVLDGRGLFYFNPKKGLPPQVRARRFHLGIGAYWLRFTCATPVLITKLRMEAARQDENGTTIVDSCAGSIPLVDINILPFDVSGKVSQNGQLLSRRGDSPSVHASGIDAHCDSITSRFGLQGFELGPPRQMEFKLEDFDARE